MVTPLQLQENMQLLEAALDTLKQAGTWEDDPENRSQDATIQRFEYTLELFWKLIAQMLRYLGHNVTASPRTVIGLAIQSDLLGGEDLWMRMLMDRNLTSHTYKKFDAKAVYMRIKSEYIAFMLQQYGQFCEHYRQSVSNA